MPNTIPSNVMSGAEQVISSTSTGIRLAPDLDAPSRHQLWFESVTFDPQGALTEALGLTGKWAIFGLRLEGLTAESITVVMKVDGIDIWNDTFVAPTSLQLYGNPDNSNGIMPTPFLCRREFSLQIQTLTDTSVTLQYEVRPIL